MSDGRFTTAADAAHLVLAEREPQTLRNGFSRFLTKVISPTDGATFRRALGCGDTTDSLLFCSRKRRKRPGLDLETEVERLRGLLSHNIAGLAGVGQKSSMCWSSHYTGIMCKSL